MKISMVGVNINSITKTDLLKNITHWMQGDKPHYIATVNPEFIVAASKDNEFKSILNRADMTVPDGFGLQLLSGFKFKERITGADLMQEICRLAEQYGKSIYLVGGADNVAKLTAGKLLERFSHLKIAGHQDGVPAEQINIQAINRAETDIIFVALGQVKQEKWIKENLTGLPSVKLAMGVGGSFDYISGNVKRAPKFMRSLGLEWLYRLIQQPARIKRIFNAVVVFPLSVLKNKFSLF